MLWLETGCSPMETIQQARRWTSINDYTPPTPSIMQVLANLLTHERTCMEQIGFDCVPGKSRHFTFRRVKRYSPNSCLISRFWPRLKGMSPVFG